MERYLERRHGLLVIDDDSPHDHDLASEDEKADPRYAGVPRRVTVEVLESEDYLRFSIACSLCYALVGRLDKLMIISKSKSFGANGIQVDRTDRLFVSFIGRDVPLGGGRPLQ